MTYKAALQRMQGEPVTWPLDSDGYNQLASLGRNRRAAIKGGLNAVFSRSSAKPPDYAERRYVTVNEPGSGLLAVSPAVPLNGSNLVRWDRETATGTPAARAEGGQFTELGSSGTAQTATPQSYGAFVPITEEQVADNPAAVARLERRVSDHLRRIVDTQALSGDGTGVNQTGVLAYADKLSQAVGTLPLSRAVLTAAEKLATDSSVQPDGVALHPRLLYSMGKSSDQLAAAVQSLLAFGLRLIPTFGLGVNQCIVGDYGNGLDVIADDVLIGDEPRQQAAAGSVSVPMGADNRRLSVRLAVAVYRPDAFCEITDIS